MISLRNTGIDGLDQALVLPTTEHVRLFIWLRLSGIMYKREYLQKYSDYSLNYF